MTDKEYIKTRNDLIPYAEKAANKAVKDWIKENGMKPTGAVWDRAFHKEMNRLSFEAGLTNWE